MSPLTIRETEVLELLRTGACPKEIATELRISANTARNHVKSIYRKTETHTRGELLVRFGTVQPERTITGDNWTPLGPEEEMTEFARLRRENDRLRAALRRVSSRLRMLSEETAGDLTVPSNGAEGGPQ